ncbi:sialidase family protein [Bellilinea caldifistulae]|nr:sialidase family protein [Bellilinea caldifistulae]
MISKFFFLLFLIFVWFIQPMTKVTAQAPDIDWQPPVNISNSEMTSTDPFLLADPAGLAHLFWAEKTGPTPGNSADTIMYSVWNGKTWSRPIDLYISPLSDGNPISVFPRAVIDEDGTIHLIWMTLPDFPRYALNYRQVPSWEATNLNAWSPPIKLDANLTGQQYSADIAYNPEQGLHIAYASGTGGIQGRAISYLTSQDKGVSWSEPRDIFQFADPERGGSNIRILLEPPGFIYLSWTEWDRSGNGQAVYFTYSEDNGKTWANPFPLSVRLENEYERDWNNMALLGPGQLVSIWEGGFRAYRGAMYSYDHGKTWTTPFDVFPILIGDNGAVQFANDSKGRLHTFIANRVREGYDIYGSRLGLWHSVYLGNERWSKPTIASVFGGDTNMTNPTVTIVNGNTIVAAWYGSQIYEIYVMTGIISDAPSLPPSPWPIINPMIGKTVTVEETPSTTKPELDAPKLEATVIPTFSPIKPTENPGSDIYISAIFPVLIIVAFLALRHKHSRHQ